jgi:hypothetical protein
MRDSVARAWSNKEVYRQRLTNGNLRFRMDAQAVPIDAAGTFRYFVRAAWVESTGIGLLMAAWLRPELSVEFIEKQWSSGIRVPNSDSMDPDLDNLPKILNVIEHDGATEIMRFERGYESFWVGPQRYAPEGLTPPDISYSYGC